jgi:hypothetical protein
VTAIRAIRAGAVAVPLDPKPAFSTGITFDSDAVEAFALEDWV